MRRILLPTLAAGLIALVGCARETETAPAAKTTEPVATATPGTKAHGETGCCDDQPTPVAAKPVVVVAAKPNDAPIQIQSVKYDQLKEALKAQKGKIVVVDVWGTFCIPCMKEFPHLVELHQEHAKDGVVCMSVSVDDPTPEKKAKALEFLTKKGATFQNFLLDEDSEVWQKNWKVNGVPIVFVFNRDGSQAMMFNSEDPDKPFTYKDVKAKVEELLKK
jgi:thiol-disulfide isomerase/thioredoxin